LRFWRLRELTLLVVFAEAHIVPWERDPAKRTLAGFLFTSLRHFFLRLGCGFLFRGG
jgi:hypothetical protein